MSLAGGLLRLELLSDPEMLGVVRSALMRLAEELGFPEAECRGVTRAVEYWRRRLAKAPRFRSAQGASWIGPPSGMESQRHR